MNCETYLKQLKFQLRSLPENEVEDILRDQREFIADAKSQNKSEAEIIDSMGPVLQFARSILADSIIQKAPTNSSAGDNVSYIISTLATFFILLPFNFILFIGPFFGIAFTLFILWVVGGAFSIANITTWALFLKSLLSTDLAMITHLASAFYLLGLTGTLIICLWLLWLITKGTTHLTIQYIRWNFQLIQKLK